MEFFRVVFVAVRRNVAAILTRRRLGGLFCVGLRLHHSGLGRPETETKDVEVCTAFLMLFILCSVACVAQRCRVLWIKRFKYGCVYAILEECEVPIFGHIFGHTDELQPNSWMDLYAILREDHVMFNGSLGLQNC